VRRVVVISDGRANVGPSSAAEFGDLAAGSTENGTQITAIGVGLDYDENTLGALAVRSAGRLYHLEQPEQMAAILQDELQMLSRTVATNAVIEFVPAEGVVVEATDQLRLDRVRRPGAHPRRQPLLRAAPRGAAPGEGERRRRGQAARWAARSSSTRAPATWTRRGALEGGRRWQVEFVSDEARSAASAHERVQAMVTRFEAAQSQMRAAQMINEGQAERAEAELQRAEERTCAPLPACSSATSGCRASCCARPPGSPRVVAAARRAASAPSAAAVRGASLQNRSSAMDAYGY
jgi:Ca-activated chloride channel family protein